MAKNSVTDWSETAGDNTDIAAIDIDEGCAPGGINGAIRTIMAQVRSFFKSSVFLLRDSADQTKLLAFNLSGITTNTKRTVTAANGSGTMSLTEIAETFAGIKTFTAIPVMAAGGIAFPSTQVPSADANTLDDYEEGTFTPIVKGSTAAGVGTYLTQDGRYTKIGDVVSFKMSVVWSAHTGTGNLIAGGVPFNARAEAVRPCLSIVSSNLALTASNVEKALKTSANADISIEQTPVGGGAITPVSMDTGATILISGQYWV